MHAMAEPEKWIVTGAAGHLGSHLVPKLVQEGAEVVGIDLAEPDEIPHGASFVRTNLADTDLLPEALAGASLIVHCASVHPWKKYTDDQYLDLNVKGTWHLYAAAAELSIDRIVLTSSIAACGYHAPPEAWPVTEDADFHRTDLYGLTKQTQESIARLFAARGEAQTIALRPPGFMPKNDLETGVALTGCYAVVEDIAAAHVAAVRVLTGRQQPGAPLEPFEAIFTTNRLPYTADDAELIDADGRIGPLVEKYWPDAHEWLAAHGYRGGWLPSVYDLSKAKALLGWQPKLNFDQWWERHRGT
jgi:nucleoside-diphosphate-sugar epimerase